MATVTTGCRIAFDNPSGYRHKSLLGYMLTSAGIPENETKQFIQQNYQPIENTFVNRTKIYDSKYAEPDFSIVEDFVKGYSGNLKTRLDYLNSVQDFFDANDLTIDTEYNLTDLINLSENYLKNLIDSEFALSLEIINPEAVPSERRYRIYPELPTLQNKQNFQDLIINQAGQAYHEEKGRIASRSDVFIDSTNPSVLDTVERIIKHSSTLPIEKELLTSLLPAINLYPELTLKVNYGVNTYDITDPSELGQKVVGVFDASNHTITMLPYNSMSPTEFRHVFIHELVHAFTLTAMINPKTEIEKNFVKEISAIYKAFKEKYKDKIDPKNGLYRGFADEREFVAEFFTNPKFRELFKEEPKKTNPFTAIINFIKKLANLKPKTTIENLDSLFEEFMGEIMESQKVNTSLDGKQIPKAFYSISSEDFINFQAKFSTPNEYKERLDNLLNLNPLDWAKVFQESKNLKENINQLYDAEQAYSDINPEDVKKSVESFYDFLYETALYLRGLNRSLTNLKDNEILSSEELFRKAAHAKEIGLFFQNYMQEFNTIFKNKLNGTILEAPAKNVKVLADSLVDTFYNDATEEVAKKLAQTLSLQTDTLKPQMQAEIKRLEEQVEKAKQSNSANLLRQAQSKLEEAKKALNQIATPENLQKALKGQLKDVSRLALYLESATLSGNILAGAVGTFITNINDSANAKAIKLEADIKRVGLKLEKSLKSGAPMTGLGFDEVFSPFLVKKVIKEIKGNEIVERESLFLISEMDEIAYQNDMTEFKFKLKQLESIPSKTEDILNQIDRIEKQITQKEFEFEERPYTEEYYALQDLLSEDSKEARSIILDQMKKIRISPFEGEQSDEQLDQLDFLKRQLDLLESDTDEYGTRKEQKGLEIAANIRAWKEKKTTAQLMSYSTTPEHREIFDTQLQRITENFEKAEKDYEENKKSGASMETLAYYESVFLKRKQEYDAWIKNNTIRKINPKFYEERRAILERINAVQKRYSGATPTLATDLWDEMFSLLKAFKNKDGFYEGSKIPFKDESGKMLDISIPKRIKEIEVELEEIKESLSGRDDLSQEDYTILTTAYTDLARIQEKVPTPDYALEVKNIKAKLRTALVAESSAKGSVISSELLEISVEKKYKNSEWFKSNHRLVWKYNPSSGQSQQVWQPLFFWATSEPKDKSLISFTEPSFRWSTPQINPAFLNKSSSSRSSKRVALRKSNPVYKSAEYQKLSTTQKEILEEITQIYSTVQKGLPKNLKRGLELPAVEKEGLEFSGKKFGTVGAQIKGYAGSIWDDMTFQKEDDKDTDEEGSVLNKANRRLYLRYSKPITKDNVDKISVNFLNTITRYGTDVIRFKEAYEQLPYIYGIQDLVDTKLGKTNVGKMVNNLLERHLNGKTTKTLFNNNVGKAAEWAIAKGLSTSASMALSLSLPSSLKNFGAGSLNLATQLKTYGIELKDVHEAMLKNTNHIGDFFKSHVEDGIDSLYMQKVRYFNILTENHLNDAGRNLFVSKTKKFLAQGSTAFTFVRKFGEFEMRSAAAEALSKNFLVEQDNGTFLPIMDCYDFIDGVITPKSTIKDLDNFPAVEQMFRGRLNSMNSLIHGAYSHMDRGEYTRYTFGRLLGYMKGWVTYQTLRRFGNRRIDYRGGTQYQGFYRTVWQAAGLLLGNRSMGGTWNLLSTQEKNEVISAGLDSATLLILMAVSKALMAVVYSDDDDDEDHGLAYFALYNMLMLEDELATLHPLAGPAAMYYSRVVNNVNGKNAITYYLDKNLIQPFRSPWEALKLLGTALNPFDDVNLFDEYVPRSRNGKVLNPNQFPINPTLKGQTEVMARLERLFRIDATWNYTFGNNPEYMYRTYERNNERWFLSSLDSELKGSKKEINSIKKQIKSIERQIGYVEDEGTKANLRSQIDELNRIKLEAIQKRDELEDIPSEGDIQ
jgi:hypothetical protein